MSMVSIGKFGYADPAEATGRAVVTCDQWVRDGDNVSCGGWIESAGVGITTLAGIGYERERLLGLIGNEDEPKVPVVCFDATQTGYYRVLGASCPWDLAKTIEEATLPAIRWSAELQWVHGSPVHEAVLVGALRTNSHAIALGDVQAVYAVPDNAVGFAPNTALSKNTKLTADGTTIARYDDGTPASPQFFNARQHWTLAPASYYYGACHVVRDAGDAFNDGSLFKAMVGRRPPVIDPELFGLTNGMVRLSPAIDDTEPEWMFEWYDPVGAAWYTKLFVFGGDDTDFLVWPSSVTIIRNHPDICTVRCNLTAYDGAAVDDNATLDLTIRRGSRIVEGFLQSDIAAKWQIRVTPNEGNTAITGGRRATSDDASGNRYLLLCPDTFTDVTTGDGIALNADATTFRFGIAMEVDGTSAVTPWQATQLVEEFYGVVGARHWISRP